MISFHMCLYFLWFVEGDQEGQGQRVLNPPPVILNFLQNNKQSEMNWGALMYVCMRSQ